VDFENRPSPRVSVPDGSGLGQFANIALNNKATISFAPSALLAFFSHSLGLTAQAIIFSALRASSLLQNETDSKNPKSCQAHELVSNAYSVRCWDRNPHSAILPPLRSIAKAWCIALGWERGAAGCLAQLFVKRTQALWNNPGTTRHCHEIMVA